MVKLTQRSIWCVAVTVLWVAAAFASLASPQSILEAAREGDAVRVEALLAEDANKVNDTDDRACTALHFASERGDQKIVRMLLEKGSDINAADVDGDTPLHWAAFAGHAGVAAILIDGGAPVGAADKTSNTPIHYAARRGHADVVSLLIERGADVNARNYDGQPPLARAAMGGHADAARRLIEAGADLSIKDNYGRTPLLLVARESGDVQMAKLLIDAGADVDAQDKSGDTPLILAAWRGFGPLVDRLLDQGAKLPKDKHKVEQITRDAATRGLTRLFVALADGGADIAMVNNNGGSLLHSAAEGGSKDIVDMLLREGLDGDARDRYGWTPLHYAAKRGREDVAVLLIERGADIDARTLAGYTALGLAEEFERGDVARLLRSRGSKATPLDFPELRGKYIGQTPPQSEPVLFAVDIVSSNRFEHGTVTFSPDGTEAFWGSSYFLGESGYTYGRLLTTRVEDGRWTAPRMAEFSGVRLGDGEPFFSPDGKRLYFLSRRALEEGGPAGELGIWFVDRTSTGWSEPRRLEGGPNAIGLYWQFSVAQNGNIYFGSSVPGGLGRSDIYVSRFAGGEYLEAENLGPVVNGEWSDGSPFVAPDESYLIITRGEHPDNLGDSDLWISFRDAGGSWTTPVNLPAPINSESREICPQVTGDGKYLLFNSFRNGQADNYWVDAGIIARLRSRRSQ